MSTMITSLAVPPKHYPTWEAYADARHKAIWDAEESIRRHLFDGGRIRENFNGQLIEWPSPNSGLKGDDLVFHLLSRFLGFGTRLELL